MTLRAAVPFVLLAACDAEAPDDAVHGQAWHMATAPALFGADVLPAYAGCTSRASVDGQPYGFAHYDRRGRITHRETTASADRPVWTWEWAGDCIARTELRTETTRQTTVNHCHDGWPSRSVTTTESLTDGTAAASESVFTYTFEDQRLVQTFRDGVLEDTYRWKDGLPVAHRPTAPDGLPPDALEVTLEWDDGRVRTRRVGGLRTDEWTYDDLGRLVEQHEVQRGFERLQEVRAYTGDHERADTWTLMYATITYDIV